MVDRLEELLEMMEAEDEDEQREDVLALADRTVPEGAPPEGDDGVTAPAGDGGNWDALTDPTEEETGWSVPLTAEEPVPGWERTSGDGPAGPEGGTVLKAEAARRWELAEAPEKAAAEAGNNWPEVPGTHRSVEQGGKPAQTVDRGAQSGLEELYRRTAQASRPPVQNLPVEQAGRMRQAEEPGRTAALTVDELDRAVRRDSRRYDGGITIF